MFEQLVNNYEPLAPNLDACVIESFERRADESAERDAIRLVDSSGSSSTSFAELDSWANAIAHELIARRGTNPEPVPLAVCRPELMLAAALGTMKAGKFYVAVNPLHPVSRMRCVLDELDAPLLLCDCLGEPAALHGVHALSVEELILARGAVERPGLRFAGERLAYVLYTSGSTGRPRGIAQSRRDMLHNVARHRPLAIGGDDCVSLISTDGFVASVSNPYIALLAGATLTPYVFREEGVDRMIDWLAAADVTVLYVFPSFLRQLAATEPERRYERLRLVYLGGETVLSSDLAAARRLFPGVELSVGLNSSETGLTCLHRIPVESALPDPVPVGRPVLDVEVAIVDEHGARVPDGAPGEIEVRSEYVRPCYWERGAKPQGGGAPLDQRRPDRHLGEVSADRDHVLAFRTKDRGRIGVDGLVHHIGRIDTMFKVRGFRIESAEVESAIYALDGVAEAAVSASMRDSAESELVAYVIEREKGGVDAVAVRAAVARELPDAMIPAHVLIVDALPRTTNGKLDRRGLAQLELDRHPGAPSSAHDESLGIDRDRPMPLDDRHQAGSDDSAGVMTIERQVADVWRSVLAATRVEVDDDFFMLGGTSIDAISVVAELRERFGVRIPLRALFRTPTVRALAQALMKGTGAENDAG